MAAGPEHYRRAVQLRAEANLDSPGENDIVQLFAALVDAALALTAATVQNDGKNGFAYSDNRLEWNTVLRASEDEVL